MTGTCGSTFGGRWVEAPRQPERTNAFRAEPGEHQVVREDRVPGGLADLLGGVLQETPRAALGDPSATLALHMVVMAVRGLVSAAPITDVDPADQVLLFQVRHGAKDRRVIRGRHVLAHPRQQLLDRPRM